MGRRRAVSRAREAAAAGGLMGVDDTLDQLRRAIKSERLIPVIGDTIRLGHIFDLERGSDGESDAGEPASPEARVVRRGVVEDLASWWAEDIGYPLTDNGQLARVAQFRSIQLKNETLAKEDYLTFLKRELLALAEEAAEVDNDSESLKLVAKLRNDHTMSFADIVKELDYPHFEENSSDPLWVLSRLPIKIYLTTGYYDFIERALVAAGKKPVSRLCFWNMKQESVAPEHRPDPDYEPDVQHPVVYHLLGMERYPESLVLTEDDYLSFLWHFSRDKPGDSGDRFVPPYLEAELKTSTLLLLGYRLEDWDLRVLFHGLLNPDREASSPLRPSVAIQIDPKDQPLVRADNVPAAEKYLNAYFEKANFTLKCQDSDVFVTDLWRAWQEWEQEG